MVQKIIHWAIMFGLLKSSERTTMEFIDADTYVWQAVRYKAEELTIDYQDTEGNSIADTQKISGNIEDSYDVSGKEYKLEIAVYTFKEVKGELKGTLTDKAQAATYVYTKDTGHSTGEKNQIQNQRSGNK